MCIRIIQHYYIMQKMDGKICDSCRSQFYPGDTVHEVCSNCFNNVWCITNIYEDDSRELSSIHRTEEDALQFMLKKAAVIERMNQFADLKIKKQVVAKWAVL